MDRKAYVSGADPEKLKCAGCGCGFVNRRVTLSYVGHNFSVEVPCCPRCGNVYIPMELAEGKMREVETMLEDK